MSKQSEVITAVYADEDGNILDAPGMRGMGRTGRENILLKPEDLIPLPESADSCFCRTAWPSARARTARRCR